MNKSVSFSHRALPAGGEPVPPARAEEEPGDGHPGEDEPAAVPGGLQVLPAGLQEHRRWVAGRKTRLV